jgi:hypothetical protein
MGQCRSIRNSQKLDRSKCIKALKGRKTLAYGIAMSDLSNHRIDHMNHTNHGSDNEALKGRKILAYGIAIRARAKAL